VIEKLENLVQRDVAHRISRPLGQPSLYLRFLSQPADMDRFY
jgi:hypothetical protein